MRLRKPMSWGWTKGRLTSLYARVLAGYILLVCLGSIVIVLALNRLGGLNHSMLELTRFTERTNTISRVREAVNSAMELRVKMDIYKDPEYKAEYGRTLEALVASLERLKGLSLSPDEKLFVSQIARMAIQEVLPKLEDGRLMDPEDATLNRFLGFIDDEVIKTDEKIYRLVLESSSQSRRAVRILLGMFLVSLLASLFVGLWVVTDLKGQVRRMIEATEHVAKGLFTTQIPEDGPNEIRALTHSFNRMVERLGELEKLKETFIANVTHEIKTPLTSVKEAVSLIKEGVVGPTTPEQDELLEIIEQDGFRLLRLVNDLLDISKMEAGMMRYQFQEGSIEEVLQRSLRKAKVVAEKVGVSLFCRMQPLGETFVFDHLRMEQVFDNLLANALNFTPKGGRVEVGLNRNPQGLLEVVFQDTGPGIPPEYHKAVFSKFFQVDTQGLKRGTGLGLSIVKHIVEAHGGHIELSSDSNRGAKFILRFPLGRVPKEEIGL